MPPCVRRVIKPVGWIVWLTPSPIEEVARPVSEPDFIGVSLRNIDDVAFKKRDTFYGTLFTLCERIRQRSPARIVVGGSGFSIFPERLLEKSGADFGIQGKARQALLPSSRPWRLAAIIGTFPGWFIEMTGGFGATHKCQTGWTARCVRKIDRSGWSTFICSAAAC